MVKLITVLISVFVLNWGLLLRAQEKTLMDYEYELASLLNELRAAKKDEQRKELNTQFKSLFEESLEHPDAFTYPFQELTSVGKIQSQDKEVRIISWNVQWENDAHDYFAYILRKEKKEGHYVVPLIDQSIMLPPQPKDQLEADQWYGALYYDIKDVQKGRKTYYTLLGYDAHNSRSTIKLLDVLHFVGKNPRFGYPMFETESGWANRIYFEHASKTVMTLRYDRERDMIVFDHLSPESPGLAEFREYYVPDMSYDAYKFEDNKWRLKEDIIAVNKEKDAEVLNLKRYDKDTDSVVNIPVKTHWEDPTDLNTPVDGGRHEAVLPDDQEQEKKSTTKTAKEKSPKEYSGVSYSNLPASKKKNKKKKKKEVI